MLYALISKQVSLLKKPPAKNDYTNDNLEFSLGDLHANAVKFIFFLLYHGVIELNDQDYKRFTEIYYGDVVLKHEPALPEKLTQQDFKNINDILKRATIKDKPKLVRFIGDELADRGTHDFIILMLFKFLFKHDINYEILFSNHSLEFLLNYEKAFENKSKLNQKEKSKKKHRKKNKAKDDNKASFCQIEIMTYDHKNSFSNLVKSLDTEVISWDELKEYVENYYLPKLKLLSYSLSEDKNTISIHSHAGIDLSIIEALANKLGVNYNDDSAVLLATTIDAINAKVQEVVRKHEFHTLVDVNVLRGAYNSYVTSENPIEYTLWNRNYSELNRHSKYKNYAINWIHGHDNSERNRPSNVICVDSDLGKSAFIMRPPFMEHHIEAEYLALVQSDVPLQKKSVESDSNVSVTRNTEIPFAFLTTVSASQRTNAKSNIADTLIINPDNCQIFNNLFQETANLRRELIEDYNKLINQFRNNQSFLQQNFQIINNLKDSLFSKDLLQLVFCLKTLIKYKELKGTVFAHKLNAIYKKIRSYDIFIAIVQLSQASRSLQGTTRLISNLQALKNSGANGFTHFQLQTLFNQVNAGLMTLELEFKQKSKLQAFISKKREECLSKKTATSDDSMRLELTTFCEEAIKGNNFSTVENNKLTVFIQNIQTSSLEQLLQNLESIVIETDEFENFTQRLRREIQTWQLEQASNNINYFIM